MIRPADANPAASVHSKKAVSACRAHFVPSSCGNLIHGDSSPLNLTPNHLQKEHTHFQASKGRSWCASRYCGRETMILDLRSTSATPDVTTLARSANPAVFAPLHALLAIFIPFVTTSRPGDCPNPFNVFLKFAPGLSGLKTFLNVSRRNPKRILMLSQNLSAEAIFTGV